MRLSIDKAINTTLTLKYDMIDSEVVWQCNDSLSERTRQPDKMMIR